MANSKIGIYKELIEMFDELRQQCSDDERYESAAELRDLTNELKIDQMLFAAEIEVLEELPELKDCNVEKPLSEFNKARKHKVSGKQYYQPSCKDCNCKKNDKWRKENPKYHHQYYKDNLVELTKTFEIQQFSIPAGIYAIYKGKKLLYIGESRRPYDRLCKHFSNRTDLDQAYEMSPISYNISIGKLNRKDLTHKMLDYIDDKHTRKQREEALIQRYNPKYNTYHGS